MRDGGRGNSETARDEIQFRFCRPPSPIRKFVKRATETVPASSGEVAQRFSSMRPSRFPSESLNAESQSS
jgi:hypothetical protein